MSVRSSIARSWIRSVAVLTPFAIAAPLACADSGSEPERAEPVVPDASILPDAAPSDTDVSVDADATIDAVAERCSSGGFCYEPLPLHAPLVAVSATSMNDAWAVGGDAVVRWDGSAWKTVYQHDAVTSGTTVSLRGVFASKTDDVWALGETPFPDRRFVVVRHVPGDGGAPVFRETLTEEPAEGDFWAGWLTPSSDALWFLASGSSSVLRFRESTDGAIEIDRWSPQGETDEGTFVAWYGLWGFAADDVYMMGASCFFGACDSLLARYDGASWSVAKVDDPQIVTGMFGTRDPAQPRQLWLESMDPSTGDRSLRLVPVSSDGGLGPPVLDRKLDGCGSLVGSAVGPAAAWLSDGCLVHRWNGTTLDVTPIAVGGEPPGRVNAVWAGSADDAWVVGTSLPYEGPDLPELGFAARRGGK